MRLCCAPFIKEASTSFVNKPIGFVSAVGCLIWRAMCRKAGAMCPVAEGDVPQGEWIVKWRGCDVWLKFFSRARVVSPSARLALDYTFSS